MKSTMQDVDLSVVDVLDHAREQFPRSTVTTSYASGARTTSFEDIHRRITQLSNGLRSAGVTIGDRVGTFAWNTQEHLECYFAVPAIGAILHTINPRFSTEQLRWCLADAGTSVIVCDSSLLASLAELAGQTSDLRVVVHFENGPATDAELPLEQLRAAGVATLSYEDLLASGDDVAHWTYLDERDAAALCYTSGTTGNPKGVVYSHRSIWLHSLVNTSAAQFALSDADLIFPIVPMFHVLAWNLPFSAFMVGSSLLLGNRWNQSSPLLQLITEHRPTFAAGVPTVWSDLAHGFDGAEGSHDISSLKRISAGGAVVPKSLIEWWQVGHGVDVLHGCGMTETSSTLTSGAPPGGFGPGSVSESQATQGRFLIGVRSRIVDDEGAPLPKDGRAAGELQLRGPWITGSYLNAEASALTEDGWLPTGDIATVSSDGYVTYTDRAKDIIKSGGEWISSIALEAHLCGHPSVLEAAIIAVDDVKWQERPAAIVVTTGTPPTETELRAWVTRAFPNFWVPDTWTFVDGIPRTSTGKFDKKALRERYRSKP